MITQDTLSALFNTMFLSSARDLKTTHTSFEGLEYPSGLLMALNRSDSTWLKKTFKLG